MMTTIQNVTKISLFAALLAGGAWLWAVPGGESGVGTTSVEERESLPENKPSKALESAEPFQASPSARQDSLSPPYVKIKLEGREVEIKLAKDAQEYSKAPCTYVLDGGQVVYFYCNGLERTPYQGQEKWSIKEIRPGLLYIQRYRDTLSYLPAPYMPRVTVRKAPVPYRLDFYSPDYKGLLRSVNLYEDNPYTKEKMPEIEIEQCYDAELGFDFSQGKVDAAYLWTYSWVVFFDNGYSGLAYSLGHYTSNRGLMGFVRTLAVLDERGQKIFRLKGIDEDISPSMVTNNGKFFGVVINKDSDRELGVRGVRIYDTDTGGVAYEDIVKTKSGYPSGLHFDGDSRLVFYEKKAPSLGEDYSIYILLDLDNRTKHERVFTKDERKDISLGAVSWATSWQAIMAKYPFKKSTF